MDKVVERWVTTSKPLESRGLWKKFVQERNQVLPQPKPSKSISDKYQDYLKAESYLEPSSQMFVRDEMGFDEGGLARTKFKIDPKASRHKQVLVQEGIYFKPKSGSFVVQLNRGPGIKTTKGVDGETMKTLGAAKKRLALFEEEFPKTISKIENPPEGSKKFLKGWMADRGVSKWEDLTDIQKSNFVRTAWPKVQEQSKLIADKIPGSEMAKLLGIDKTVLDNSRKTGAIFAKQIEKVLGTPVNLIGKAGGTAGERGEYIYYSKPTKEQIKSLKTYIPKTFGQLTQDVTNRVRILADDTEFMNDLKKIKTVDDVDKLKMLQKYTDKYPELNLTSSKLARSTLLISQVAGGNAEYRGLDNIKRDKVLSRRLNNMIENAPFGNVYKKEAYDLAMRNIDKQFGSETATFSKYRDKIKSEFKRLGFEDFKKFNLDEYVGTSIGGFKGAGQYSVFSRLLAADVNQKSGASYLGRLSQATDNLEDALALSDGKITKEIRGIVEKNMADALKTSKKTKNSLPYLSLKPPGSKENFGVKRLNQLEAQGLDFKKFYKERGFGFSGLKGAMTQKEIISRLGGMEKGSLKDEKNLANLLAKAGFRCGAKDGIPCDRPEAYFKDIEESTKAAKEGKPGAIRKFNNAGNIARKSKGALKATGLGVLAEAGFEGAFVLNDVLSGVPVKEAFQKSLFQYVPFTGLGGTKDAEASEMKRIVGKDPRSQQYAADLQSSNELNKLYKDYITKRDDVFGAYDQDMILDAENKLYSSIENFDPKTYDRLKFGSPEYEAFEAKQEVEDVNKLKRAMEIDPFKQKRMERKRLEEPSLERDYMNLRRAKEIGAIPFEDKMSLISSYGGVANMAGGGIAGVRRPHAIPPKSGPMPQGGGLSSMFNRVRKW